jgi:transcriptional regulator with XRE-family HTH domain
MKKLIGKKLKEARLRDDQTIQDLAERSGVSANMISRIERGLTIPSVQILMKLAAAFGLSISCFVEEPEKKASVVFTARGRGDPSFSVLYDTIETGCDSGGPLVQIGEEFVFVLEGCLEFQIRGETYLLNPGDALTFKAALPHQWRNVAEGPTKVLWVISPPPNVDR